MNSDLSVKGVYTFCKPNKSAQTKPILFDSPHSGTNFPDDFDIACTQRDVLEMSDLHVDALFQGVSSTGATFLKADFPRSYIDLNRAENDIDLKLLSDIWPGALARKGRARSGVGLVHRLIRNGGPLHTDLLSAKDIERRLANYYRPYHAALREGLSQLYEQFGSYIHVNCHSMPSQNSFIPLPDIVIGDRNGTSCDPAITDAVARYFKAQGFSIGINNPYRGAEIVRRSGAPAFEKHSLQIEVNRALYMDETTLKTNKNFNALSNILVGLTEPLLELSQTLFNPLVRAAE